MADGHTTILRSNRSFAHRMVDCAPMGSVMTIKPPRRSLDQNALLWARLSEISAAKPGGRELVPEAWKALFCYALGHEQRFEMALDGKGFVPLGFRTSRMSKAQMAELIDFIDAWCASNGVELETPKEAGDTPNKRPEAMLSELLGTFGPLPSRRG